MDNKKRIFEFWCIEEDGTKHHEYIETNSVRRSKVKKFIEKKFNINIETCLDFGIRQREND